MTKASDNPPSNQPLPEPNWEAGVRRTIKDGRLLALSPAPVVARLQTVDANAGLQKKSSKLAGFAELTFAIGTEGAQKCTLLWIIQRAV